MEEEMTVEERAKCLLNVAIQSPAHLKRWLGSTGRRWLVFNALDLVDALPWPAGLDSLMQLIACYRDHRRQIPSGVVEKQVDPILGQEVEVPLMKSDVLELREMDQLVRFLITEITKKEPGWTLENPIT